ncbi:MAG: hypothetical protein LQ345_001862 [Seirophora villosa]|nr:MAG: hypothetical protein LQ345_001862 [Seirophora villosa]
MASRVTYIWKTKRPVLEDHVQKLMAAAYQTATAVDPNVTTILVRSDLHDWTSKSGKWVKDAPHLTVSLKNPVQEEQKTHETSHGYSKSLDDYVIVRAVPSEYIKPDNTKDRDGDEIWPAGLKSETVVHGGG